jgi:hypothetical protein
MNPHPFPKELPEVVWRFMFALLEELLLRWQAEPPKYLILEELDKWLRTKEGFGNVVDHASSAGLGTPVSREQARGYFYRQPAGTQFVMLDLFTPNVLFFTREEILEQKNYRLVGTLLIALNDPKWAYSIPPSWPLEERRVFKILRDRVK